MGSINNASGNFLVRVDAKLFLWEITPDNEVTGSHFPSAAHHFNSYEDADAACARLHRLGHTQAVVTDSIGQGIVLADLRHLSKKNQQASDGGLFLVKLDSERFLRALDGNEISCCYEPGIADKLSYQQAALLSKKFRRRGFPQAIVTAPSGKPLTA